MRWIHPALIALLAMSCSTMGGQTPPPGTNIEESTETSLQVIGLVKGTFRRDVTVSVPAGTKVCLQPLDAGGNPVGPPIELADGSVITLPPETSAVLPEYRPANEPCSGYDPPADDEDDEDDDDGGGDPGFTSSSQGGRAPQPGPNRFARMADWLWVNPTEGIQGDERLVLFDLDVHAWGRHRRRALLYDALEGAPLGTIPRNVNVGSLYIAEPLGDGSSGWRLRCFAEAPFVTFAVRINGQDLTSTAQASTLGDLWVQELLVPDGVLDLAGENTIEATHQTLGDDLRPLTFTMRPAQP